MADCLGYFCLLLAVLPTSDSFVCDSVDIRNNVTELERLRGCTVVEGSVKIVLMEKEFVNEDFDPYTFPELREVTEYMLFYRVKGLRSLGKLFPNLEKIGGADLIEDFALVVYEMFHLQEIGLSSLREITQGSVNIMKNPNLCFVSTVKWDEITKWDAVINYDIQNQDNASCPGCPTHCPGGACWNATQCQFETEVSSCHPLCVGRCYSSGPEGCYTCKGIYDPSGLCVASCPNNTYKYLNRRCVSREECRNRTMNGRHFFVLEDKCVDSCKSGSEPDLTTGECRPCREGRCLKWCRGAVISSTGEAQKLRGCTHISGSIEITIKSETSRAVHAVLEENLGSIEYIKGYLKVTRSSLTDLNFLKNLSVIDGSDKQDDLDMNDITKTIIIIDNKNLQELWNWEVKKNFTVAEGKVFFHYNPKLCWSHIEKLLDVIGYDKTSLSSLEIDKESNGDRFPCNADGIDITVTDITNDRMQLNVTFVERLPVLRSVVYYAKDPHNNITMFDDIEQCSYNGWRTIDIHVDDSNDLDSGSGFRVNLTELEPYTFYVFYVTTYSINSVGGRSGMYRRSTLPGTPSEVTYLQAFVNSSSEIELRWRAPEHINGKLQWYIVTLYELNEDRAYIDQWDYCKNPPMAKVESYTPERTWPRVKTCEEMCGGNHSCCLNPQTKFVEKDEFDVLCDNLANAPKGFPDRSKYLNSKSYFYSYIHKSPFHTVNEVAVETLQRAIKSNEIQPFTKKKLGRNKGVSTFQNQIPDFDSGSSFGLKTKPKSIKRILVPQTSNYLFIKDLKRFQNYAVSVRACREAGENEKDIRKYESNRCSNSEIITVRTEGNNQSDAIITHEVQYKKGTLEIIWNPPVNPNGLIAAFEIYYRDTDVQNSKPITDCLTYSQYENNGYKHTIYDIFPGNYEFKIRAVTLFGKGPFTRPFNVEVKKDVSLLEVFFIVAAVFVVLVFVMFLISSYFPKPYKYGRNFPPVVIANVNPNYNYVRDKYEIDRDDVECVEELGVGSFGKVYKGRWKSKDIVCAIKTVHGYASLENEHEFLNEASVMKHMTGAHFIVEIYGVVSKGGPPMVLMELMEHGDLKSYLRKLRETKPISNATMIKMALEIADGMAYMEVHKFVHRDLAARNCMVSSDLAIKIGDFGMARDIYETDYYRKINKGFLPIRWMAPESLKDGEFTSQSDLWSYGVVLWEIVTMAEQPYQGYSNDQVLHDVIAGKRLMIPRNSPTPLMTLMERCWRTVPTKRSSFMSVVGFLDYYHDDEFKKVAFYHSEEGVAARKGMWEYVEMKSLVGPVEKSIPSTSYKLTTVDEEKTS